MNPALPVTRTFTHDVAHRRAVVHCFGNRCLTSKITQSGFPSCRIASIPIVAKLIMRDGKNDCVVVILRQANRPCCRPYSSTASSRVHPRIVNVDVGVITLQFPHEIHDARIADVGAVLLERKPKNEHIRIDDVDLAMRHQLHDAVDDVLRPSSR